MTEATVATSAKRHALGLGEGHRREQHVGGNRKERALGEGDCGERGFRVSAFCERRDASEERFGHQEPLLAA